MRTSVEQDAADSYTYGIKHYVAHAVNDLHNRFNQAGEITPDYGLIRHLKLLDPVDISPYSPLTLLLTGDTDGSRALFMRILQSMAIKRKNETTVIVPQGEGLEIANSLISHEARVDITSDKRAWTDENYLASISKNIPPVAKSKIQIVDAPSLYTSIAHASDRNCIKCLCVTGFPENDPVEELKTLKGFATGRQIPVIVLNTGEPVDHKDLWEHIDNYYHMEAVEDLEYLLTAESKRLKAGEEATVTLNPTKKWISSTNHKRVCSMNVNGKTSAELKAKGSVPSIRR